MELRDGCPVFGKIVDRFPHTIIFALRLAVPSKGAQVERLRIVKLDVPRWVMTARGQTNIQAFSVRMAEIAVRRKDTRNTDSQKEESQNEPMTGIRRHGHVICNVFIPRMSHDFDGKCFK